MTMHRRDLLVAGGAAAAALTLASQVRAQEAAPAAPAPMAEGGDVSAFEALNREERISVINLRDIEAEASKILPPASVAFVVGGAGDEWTMRQNEAAFDNWIIEPDYLSGTPRAPDTAATLLGSSLTLPVITAPMGLQAWVHARKELPGVEGTNAAGTLYTTTSVASLSMEEVAAAATGPKWFQIYFPQDRGFAVEQLQRAKAAGYTAIVITVDSTTVSNRERPLHVGIPLPDFGMGNVPQTPGIDPLSARIMKADLDWADVELCAAETGLPVVVKGVLTPGLAAECVRRGVAGVWVSNHGGRGIDRLAPAISALPRIADAVAGGAEIIIDSGFRRGQDVFMALALGANAVALGRPVLYGMTLGGSLGVQAVYQRLRGELQMVMQLAGTPNLAAIRRDHLLKLSEL